MKLLLDESIPYRLRSLLVPLHDVTTVSKVGWSGIENGTLLALAASRGFDALITTDRGIEYQQNQMNFPCSVIVLIARTNKLDDLRPLVSNLLAALDNAPSRSFVKVAL